MQVSKQSQKHAAQLEAFQYGVGSRRPAKPHCSKELLNQRRVVDLLARQGCYSKAAAVQQATNGMEAAEMKATLASFEAEVCLPSSCLQSNANRGQFERYLYKRYSLCAQTRYCVFCRAN